jgi:hypothetical protein
MKLKHLIAGAAVTGSVGLAAIGVGSGVANADPPPPMPIPGQPDQHQGPPPDAGPGGQQRGPGGPGWRPPQEGPPPPAPFEYSGQWVNPVFDQDRHGWGFWFLGSWIPL